MAENKDSEFKRVEQVKIKVSDNGNWLIHRLPEHGLIVSFPLNYYRTILASHGYSLVAREPTDEILNGLTPEERISIRVGQIEIVVNQFNQWVYRTGQDCRPFVLAQIADEHTKLIQRSIVESPGFISSLLNDALDKIQSQLNHEKGKE